MYSQNSSFSLRKVQESLQFLCDSFEWLTTADNFHTPGLADDWNKDTLKDVTTTIEKLLIKVRNVENHFSPINRLPPEILSSILFNVKSHEFIRMEWQFDLTKPTFDICSRWHSTGLVCKHWREITVNHPALWDTICVALLGRYRHNDKDVESIGLNLSSRALERSGIVPLTVVLQLEPSDTDTWNEPRLRAILSQMPRIRHLKLQVAPEASEVFQLLAPLEATFLETLSISGRAMRSSHQNSEPLVFNHWSAPRLRSLLVSEYVGWRASSFGGLRHLLIGHQSFDFQAFIQLLDVLAANPMLEDLFLDKVELSMEELDERGIEQKVEKLAVVEMPNLTRLNISAWRKGHMHLIATKMVLQAGCAQVYQGSAVILSNAQPASFVPQKLSICSTDFAIATDMQTALLASSHLLLQSISPMRLDGITELWLCGLPSRWSWPRAVSVFNGMQSVLKLVIDGCHIKYWLEVMGNDCLPSLTNMQLRSARSEDGRPLLNFLQHRQDAGRQIELIHFIRPPANSNTQCDAVVMFNAWRKNRAKFQRFVREVRFDNLEDIENEFELPSVCTTPSSFHSCWRAWHWNKSL